MTTLVGRGDRPGTGSDRSGSSTALDAQVDARVRAERERALEDRPAPSARALLVIDMLVDFAAPLGALYSPLIGAIIPAVRREIEGARRRGDAVIFVGDGHDEHDAEFQLFPPHAVRETPGSAWVDGLGPLWNEATVRKTRYSGFYGTELEYLLHAREVRTVRLVGDCTNICVFFTAADARNRDLEVEVVRDAVASFDPEAHRHALEQLERILGCHLV